MSNPTHDDRDRPQDVPRRDDPAYDERVGERERDLVRDRDRDGIDDRRQTPARDRDRDGIDDRRQTSARDYDRDGVDDRAEVPRRGYSRGEVVDRDAVVEREREAYGGLKMGAAFFGWLSAMGLAVLLTALLTAVGVAVGLGTGTTVEDAAQQAQQDPSAIGWAGVIGLLVVLFIAYFAGGYVAGRMARFDGAMQGLGVWLWALIAAIVVAVLGFVAGDQFNVLVAVDGFPRIPVGEGELTTMGIIAAVVAALVPLIAAVLGGITGMRFHRAVDDAGLGHGGVRG